MKNQRRADDVLDSETIKLFVVLGLLTLALVLGLRWTLFAPVVITEPALPAVKAQLSDSQLRRN